MRISSKAWQIKVGTSWMRGITTIIWPLMIYRNTLENFHVIELWFMVTIFIHVH